MYNALVGSYLRYGIRSWGSCSETLFSVIKNAQNKIVKALLFLPHLSDAISEYSTIKMLTVKDIFNMEVVKLIHSIYHKYCPCAFANFLSLSSHNYSTRLRQNSCFSLTKAKTNFGLKSLRFSGVKIWSQVPQSIQNTLEPKKMTNMLKNMYLE